jgi:hypothetical protein
MRSSGIGRWCLYRDRNWVTRRKSLSQRFVEHLIKVGSSRITPAECFSLLNSSAFRLQGAHQHPVVTNRDSAA